MDFLTSIYYGLRNLFFRIIYYNYSPKIIENFISDQDCDYIINTYKDKLSHSRIVGDDKNIKVDSYRTSNDTRIDKDDPIIRDIMTKVANEVNVTIEHFNNILLTHYNVGEEFKPHFDVGKNVFQNRFMTAIIYLNDNYEGGKTVFNRLKKSYKMSKGSIILFHNLTKNNKIHPLSMHAGEPITKGEKWICFLPIYNEKVKANEIA